MKNSVREKIREVLDDTYRKGLAHGRMMGYQDHVVDFALSSIISIVKEAEPEEKHTELAENYHGYSGVDMDDEYNQCRADMLKKLEG